MTDNENKPATANKFDSVNDDLTFEFTLDTIVSGLRHDDAHLEFWRAELDEFVRVSCNIALAGSTKASAAPEGMALVPVKPTEQQWSGLPRDIIFAFRSSWKAGEVLNFLNSIREEPLPAWLTTELSGAPDHTLSKGTCAILVYRAFLDAAAPQAEEASAESSARIKNLTHERDLARRAATEACARAEGAETKLAAIRSGLEGLTHEQQRECIDCDWKGPVSETLMCGSVGPLCPECRTTTEISTEPACACGGTGTAFGKRCECKGMAV